MSRHAAVVLAAGGSTRLGRPKQLLRRAGETLVHRAVRLAQATAPARLLVVTGAYAAPIAAELRGLACRQIANAHWRDGLGGSLRAAASGLAGFDGPVLVLVCDQPALESAHLQALLAGADSAPAGCAATRHGNAPGVPAVVPADWFHQLGEGRGDHGFGPGLRSLDPAALFALDAPELGFDLDRPADLDAAVARGLLDPPGRGRTAAVGE